MSEEGIEANKLTRVLIPKDSADKEGVFDPEVEAAKRVLPEKNRRDLQDKIAEITIPYYTAFDYKANELNKKGLARRKGFLGGHLEGTWSYEGTNFNLEFDKKPVNALRRLSVERVEEDEEGNSLRSIILEFKNGRVSVVEFKQTFMAGRKLRSNSNFRNNSNIVQGEMDQFIKEAGSIGEFIGKFNKRGYPFLKFDESTDHVLNMTGNVRISLTETPNIKLIRSRWKKSEQKLEDNVPPLFNPEPEVSELIFDPNIEEGSFKGKDGEISAEEFLKILTDTLNLIPVEELPVEKS